MMILYIGITLVYIGFMLITGYYDIQLDKKIENHSGKYIVEASLGGFTDINGNPVGPITVLQLQDKPTATVVLK